MVNVEVSYRYMVRSEEQGGLISLSLQQFVHSVGARTAAPGGGSVSAAIASMVSHQRPSSRGINLHVIIAVVLLFL